MVHTDLAQNLGVSLVIGLCPNQRHIHVHQCGRGQQRRLDITADGNDHTFGFIDAELLQYFRHGGVGGDHVVEGRGQLLNHLFAMVYAENLDTASDQLLAERLSETPHAKDYNRRRADLVGEMLCKTSKRIEFRVSQ